MSLSKRLLIAALFILVLAGEYEAAGVVWGIDVVDGYAYVANGNHGLLSVQWTAE